MQLKVLQPKLALYQDLVPAQITIDVSVVFTLDVYIACCTACVHKNMTLAALLHACCYLLPCLPAAANLYIVVSQDVVTVILEVTVHVLTATSKNIIYFACYFHRGIST